MTEVKNLVHYPLRRVLRNLKRRCCYYLHLTVHTRWVLLSLFQRFIVLPVFCRFPEVQAKAGAFVGNYGQITILDYFSPKHHTSAEIEETACALSFTEEVDPRRFRRIQQAILYITLSASSSKAGSYAPICRQCWVHPNKVPQVSDPLERVLFIGAIIVHEATHGFLDSKRFPYTKLNRPRIEALCNSEHRRFLQRAARCRGALRRHAKQFGILTDAGERNRLRAYVR